MKAETTPAHWVFLRGLVRESAHWDDFPERFAERMAGIRAHLVDLPGNGNHWQLDSPLSVAEMAEFARTEALAEIAESNALPRIYLFSISLGSMVAIEWMRRHPDEIAGAVLINTSLRGLSPMHRRLSLQAWPLLACIVACRQTAERERLILQLTSAIGTPDAALIETRVAIHQRHPVRIMNVFRQLWAAAHYRPSQEKPKPPLLLLNSQGDRMVDPSCTVAICRRWGGEMKTHPWAGHDLPLDDPEWTIAAVKDWRAPC